MNGKNKRWREIRWEERQAERLQRMEEKAAKREKKRAEEATSTDSERWRYCGWGKRK